MAKKKVFMSVTATAFIASAVMLPNTSDAISLSDKPKEIDWTASIKHDLKVKNIDAEQVLTKRTAPSQKDEKKEIVLPEETDASSTYKVESGDTLSEIAYKLDVSTEDLMKWNNLDSTIIVPGLELIIHEDGALAEEDKAEELKIVEKEETKEAERQVASNAAEEERKAEEEKATAEQQAEEQAAAEREAEEERKAKEEAEAERQAEKEAAAKEEEKAAEAEAEEQAAAEEAERQAEEERKAEEAAEAERAAEEEAAAEAEAEEERKAEEEAERAESEEQSEEEEAATEEGTQSVNAAQTSATSANVTTQDNSAQEKAEKEEQERIAKEKAEKEEQERIAKEKAEKEEQERIAKEKAEKEEQERIAKEKAEKEEQERIAAEKKKEEEKQQSQGQGVSGDLIATAQSVIGTPYVWGGSQPGGFDCSGFIHWAHKESGNDIGRNSTDGYYNQSYIVDNPQVGDLVFFENTYRSGISHMGIYIGGGQMIHAGTSSGVTVADVHGPYWDQYFHSYKRFY